MPLCIVAAAGPGMGAAIARRFAREGFDLALVARDAARLETMAVEFRALGVTVTTHSADLSAPNAIAEVFAEIASEQGPAQVLVYNGARWNAGPAITQAPSEFHKDLALCATGALACAQQVYPAMKAAGAGTILFTGGGLALFPQAGAGVASLTAGKSALRGLTFAMAGELAADGIHLATVTIGGTVSDDSDTFAPDLIAERYWALHKEPAGSWTTETVVANA